MSPDAQDVSSRNIDQKKDSRDQADRAEGFFRNPFLQSSDHGQGSIDQKDARESKQEYGTKTDVSVDIAPVPDFRVVVPETQSVKEMKQDNVIRNSQRSEIKWRKIRFTERFMLASGIRRNNFRCIGRYIKYSFIPAAAIAALAYFVNMYLAAVLAGCYVLSLIVFSFILE